MNTISDFFVGMNKDYGLLVEVKDSTDNVRELRLYSLGLRAIGLVAAAASAVFVLAAVVAVASSILLSIVLLVTAVVAAVFAHDCIVSGNKFHHIAALFDPVVQDGFLGTIGNVGKKIRNAMANVVPTGFQAAYSQTSFFLTDTLVFKHLATLCGSGKTQLKAS